ncbi:MULTISPECIES: AarF/UbiB family protein [unclassified Streptomyces]|uniref:ABC1 kinase family protein n=1 Tax=unclassified Streptomyces TaxID=2593676 RepID=UPI002E113F9F|nr:AarF/UbiB family protein [Streptomyces sp. NBC_01197]WSS49064.1 AarF/UbiB family protein [Streptomyces sp. NBC_01180]
MVEHRARHTAHVLTRLGMHEVSRAAGRRRSKAQASERTAEEQRARAIRQALEQLGPLYVKIGQILSTRPDFVPDYVRDELALLTDQAAVRPFATFVPTLEEELGADWRESFSSFETGQPLGSASLAQVYRATRRDGTPCVVKIQRPDSQLTVRGDMVVLRRATRLIGRLAPRFNEVVDTGAMLDVVFRAMGDELDFTREASNMKDARKSAKEFKRVKVPKALVATPRVLVQTFADGQAANRLKDNELSRKQRKKMAKEFVAYMLKGFFVDRNFHADPHPGNVLVSPDGKAHVIDWGMVGRIDRSTSAAMLGTMIGMAYNDGPALAQSWIQMGSTTPWSDIGGFTADIARFVPHIANASLAELNFGVALTSVLAFSSSRGIQTTPNVSIVGKAVANMEGTVRHIHPALKLSDSIRDALQDVLLDMARDLCSPEQLAQYGLHTLHSLTQGPGQAVRALDDVADRQLTVHNHTRFHDTRFSRPAFALALLALRQRHRPD